MARVKGVAAAAVCVALCIAISACGDNGGSTEASGSSKLRVVNTGQYDPTALGPDAGDYLGTFKDAGLDVETLYGQDVVEALASDDVQLGISSPNRIVGAIEQGLKAKIIGSTVTSWVQYIIVSKQSGITSIDDFHGGKIGISRFGSAGHYSALRLADELGWQKDDYTLVPLSDLDGLTAALQSGQIDAFTWSAEASFGIENEGTGVIIGNVADIVKDTPLNVLVASDEVIDAHPELVKKFCTAFYDAQSQFAGDEALAQKAFESWGTDAGIAKQMMQYIATDSTMSDDTFTNIADATNRTIEGAKVTGDDVKGMYEDCSQIG
jgi:ABC-type nitrate/sulfonate/bicarbonate transport system substrate-binding protein